MHDKELGGCGVGVIGSRHRKHATGVLEIVLREAVCGKLAVDSRRVSLAKALVVAAALNHKTADDAVEDQSAVKSAFDKTEEIFNSLWCFFGVEFCGHCAKIFYHNFNFRVVHNHFPFLCPRYPNTPRGRVHLFFLFAPRRAGIQTGLPCPLRCDNR